MTVSMLITLLQDLPPDAEVVAYNVVEQEDRPVDSLRYLARGRAWTGSVAPMRPIVQLMTQMRMLPRQPPDATP